MLYQRILIPTDGSEISHAAAYAGVEFAKEFNAEVIGIYVAPDYSYPIYAEAIPPSYPTLEEIKDSATKTGEKYLKEIQDAAISAALKFTPIIEFSDSPARQIVEVAEKNACDLIFIGSHGRSGLGQLLLGSVTYKILSTCQIPVLVYRVKKETAR